MEDSFRLVKKTFKSEKNYQFSKSGNQFAMPIFLLSNVGQSFRQIMLSFIAFPEMNPACAMNAVKSPANAKPIVFLGRHFPHKTKWKPVPMVVLALRLHNLCPDKEMLQNGLNVHLKAIFIIHAAL